MLNRPTNAVTKRAVMLVGAVLAMIAMLVISSPAPNGIFAHDSPDTDHVHYAENGTRMVRDFDSTDPETDGIEWNVRGVDAADFEISSAGVLTFIDSPDYENPTDRARITVDLNNDGDEDDPGEAAFIENDNNYQITVSATEMSDALPAKRTDIALTVTVENANDPGELTLQWLQPEVDTPITATLTDSDGTINSSGGDLGWTWYTSKVADPEVGTDFHWNEITANVTQGTPAATVSSYTPQGDTVAADDDTAVDEGKHLRVKVVYTDMQSTAPRTVYGISMNPVRAQVSSPGDNGSPDFVELTDTRTVPESMAVGGDVGLPVVATDPDPEDIVTYSLEAVAMPIPNNGDVGFFDIDKATGQITVAQDLDYDAAEGRTDDAPAGTYMVIVRATDPSGLSDPITITITAEDVNEAPEITGRAELSVVEGIVDPLPGDTGETGQANRYEPVEQDDPDSIATWGLEGDDADAFNLSGNFEPRFLRFKEAPDYENPTDANKDNIYEVTIVATDTGPSGTVPGIGRTNVTVMVTNAEQAGKVVFTEGETAYLNEMLVAEVQDPDDHGGDLGEPYQGVHVVTWQWSRSLTEADAGFEDIADETTNRYTPKDSDRGYYLRVTATYTDPHSAEDNPATIEDERITAADSLRTVVATTEVAVRVAPDQESAPIFAEAMNGRVTRYVAEDAVSPAPVGDPVTAKGGTGLTYTLEGSDKDLFAIDGATGQITVGMGTTFGFDDPAKPNTYQVTVKVVVPGRSTNNEAEVQVDIMVTDIDDLPVIKDADGEVVVPPVAVDFPEIKDGEPNTAAVATYVGTDPEGSAISWDLRGADAALFTIDGGVLKFMSAPDYENPKDVLGENTATFDSDAAATDNVYNIVVRTIASRASGYTGPAQAVDTRVNVTVIPVDEKGQVTISWLQPEVEEPIMASLTDPDGSSSANVPVDDTETVISPTWAWTVSKVALNEVDIGDDLHWEPALGDGASTGSYTPADSDVDKLLRVTASYADLGGPDKTERAMSAMPVQAEGGGRVNGSPDFFGDKLRSVPESAAVGSNVGRPVVASVPGGPSATDTLTYGLRAVITDDLGTTGVTMPTMPDDDLAAFDIDKASGQITLAQELDFESRPTDIAATALHDGEYVVVVTVTGPSGRDTTTPGQNDYDDVVVVITATDVNEDPVLDGRPELTINEIDGGDDTANSPDFVGNPGPPSVNVYTVTDADFQSGIASWRLEGDDAGDFQLKDTGGRTLIFTADPDYENPTDDDGDNVYKVTIVTLDGNGGRGEFDVSIAVMNVPEDGKVTLYDEGDVELVQPRAQGPITARLDDPDGSVTVVSWAWSKAGTSEGTFEPIDEATSATYTPDNTDDIGSFLRATVMYTDAVSGATVLTVMAETIHSVLAGADLKRAPAFPQEYAGGVDREIAENSPSTAYVGATIVAAEDPDGMDVTYTLEGDDAAYFDLVRRLADHDNNPDTDEVMVDTRQIRVKAPVAVMVDGEDDTYPTVDLNHEAEAPKKNTYTVMLKASDDGGLSDTITVTITVTDRNEAPSTPKAGTGTGPTPDANNAPMFPATEDGMRGVLENTATDMPIGDPVAATDADDDELTYTLGGTDMASFAIDDTTGQLMTMAALDFEMPADADMDNAYEVTVTASDGTDEAMVAVTITVTNVGLDDSYDANDDGVIGPTEVLDAVDDYFDDPSGFGGERILDIVESYFSTFSS